MGNETYDFRCPFCLDSKKNKYKKRGYFYPKDGSASFKCHNCGRAYQFSTFLYLFDNNLFREYKLEKFGKAKTPKIDFSSERMVTFQKREFDPLVNCIKLSDITEELKEVKEYVVNRGIPETLFGQLYAARSLNDISSKIEKYRDRHFVDFPVLVIPFFRNDASYSYIQCRIINNYNPNALRFITFELDKNAPKLWGENRIIWENPIYVLEGPIDAMFINNGLALAGAGVNSSLNYIIKNQELALGHNNLQNICICYDNDYLSNEEILLQLNKRIEGGFSVVLYNKEFQWKDVNDAYMKGNWSIERINKYISERTFTGLKAKLELSQLQKHKRK